MLSTWAIPMSLINKFGVNKIINKAWLNPMNLKNYEKITDIFYPGK